MGMPHFFIAPLSILANVHLNRLKEGLSFMGTCIYTIIIPFLRIKAITTLIVLFFKSPAPLGCKYYILAHYNVMRLFEVNVCLNVSCLYSMFSCHTVKIMTFFTVISTTCSHMMCLGSNM